MVERIFLTKFFEILNFYYKDTLPNHNQITVGTY